MASKSVSKCSVSSADRTTWSDYRCKFEIVVYSDSRGLTPVRVEKENTRSEVKSHFDFFIDTLMFHGSEIKTLRCIVLHPRNVDYQDIQSVSSSLNPMTGKDRSGGSSSMKLTEHDNRRSSPSQRTLAVETKGCGSTDLAYLEANN